MTAVSSLSSIAVFNKRVGVGGTCKPVNQFSLSLPACWWQIFTVTSVGKTAAGGVTSLWAITFLLIPKRLDWMKKSVFILYTTKINLWIWRIFKRSFPKQSFTPLGKRLLTDSIILTIYYPVLVFLYFADNLLWVFALTDRARDLATFGGFSQLMPLCLVKDFYS